MPPDTPASMGSYAAWRCVSKSCASRKTPTAGVSATRQLSEVTYRTGRLLLPLL